MRPAVIDRFFPEGREQWETSPEYRQRRQEAIAAVRARYAPLLAGAGPVRRLWLWWQRRRAVERELETLSPTDACFLMAPSSADPSPISTAVDFHGWRFLVNREATAAAYAASSSRGAEDCSCAHCRNLIRQRERELPSELLDFLRRVGVDPKKEAEVWEGGGLEDGLSFNSGWWHFIGEVVATGEEVIPLEPNAGALGKDWTVFFLPGETSLKLSTLPSAPLVQVEFTASLPWVLEEPYPEPAPT